MNDMESFDLLRLSFHGTSALLALILVLGMLSLSKGRRRANYFLMVIVLIYAGQSLNQLIMYTGWFRINPHFCLLAYPLSFLVGILYYLFIRTVTNTQYRLRWYLVFHMIPFLFIAKQLSGFYFAPRDIKVMALEHMWFKDQEFTLIEVIMNSIPSILVIAYLSYCLYFLKQLKAEWQEQYSNTQVEFLDWLKNFTLVFLVIMLLNLVRLAMTYHFVWSPPKYEFVTGVLKALFIQYIIFQSITRPDKLFFDFTKKAPLTAIEPAPPLAEEAQSTTQGDHQVFVEQLRRHMEQQQPYLQADLKIHELADQLKVPPHFLSKVLNQELGLNFYTFVNQYRIEEFKRQVLSQDGDNLTLTGIALNAGFNSKASFNRIFKKHTQMTPSAFVAQQKVSTSKNKPLKS